MTKYKFKIKDVLINDSNYSRLIECIKSQYKTNKNTKSKDIRDIEIRILKDDLKEYESYINTNRDKMTKEQLEIMEQGKKNLETTIEEIKKKGSQMFSDQYKVAYSYQISNAGDDVEQSYKLTTDNGFAIYFNNLDDIEHITEYINKKKDKKC